MNLMQVKINANATSDTNDYANGSNVKQPKVAQVGTMNPNAGRRWGSSLLLLGIVFSALAFSAEAKADISYIEDVGYISNGVLYKGEIRMTFIGVDPNTLGYIYKGEYKGYNIAGSPIYLTGTIIPEGPGGVKPPIPEHQLSVMDISYNSYLEIKSPIDVTCDIYELSSGKQVMKDINIQGNSAGQPVQMQTNSHHYLVQFKALGAVISPKTFLINNNQFYKGGL